MFKFIQPVGHSSSSLNLVELTSLFLSSALRELGEKTFYTFHAFIFIIISLGVDGKMLD